MEWKLVIFLCKMRHQTIRSDRLSNGCMNGVTSFCFSPDVSPIECVNEMMKTLLRWEPIRTMWEFTHTFQEMWTHFELEMVARPISDFPKRLQACSSVGCESIQLECLSIGWPLMVHSPPPRLRRRYGSSWCRKGSEIDRNCFLGEKLLQMFDEQTAVGQEQRQHFVLAVRSLPCSGNGWTRNHKYCHGFDNKKH